MIGAIIGDIVGSRFEYWGIKTKDFELFTEKNKFTDDTVMTVAIANALLECNGRYLDLEDLAIKNMKHFGQIYYDAGYGDMFHRWLFYRTEPYNSFGNGSAMRISAVPYFAKDLDELRWLVETVTKPTHNHPEGIKGAMATATAIWLALHKKSKQEIKEYIEALYYNLDFDYDDLIKNYNFDMTCQGSVPQSIYAFLISTSYEDAIRTAISMGGDTDTMGAITCSIAGAFYGVPENLKKQAYRYLDGTLLKVLYDFDNYLKTKDEK